MRCLILHAMFPMNTSSRSAAAVLVFCLALAGCIDRSSTGPDTGPGFPPPDTMLASARIEGASEGLFTSDGSGFIVANASEGWGRVVATLYDRATGRKIRTFDPYPALIQEFFSMALSHDGKKLVAAGYYKGSITGGSIYPGFIVYDVATGSILENSLNLPSDRLPLSLVFAPGDSILVGGLDGMLVAYRLTPKARPPYYIPEIDTTSFTGRVYSELSNLEISPSGRYILSSESSSIWDLSTRALVEDLSDTRKWPLRHVAYRGGDRELVTSGNEGVYIVSLDQQNARKHIVSDYFTDDFYTTDPLVTWVASSPDGTLVAAADDRGRVKVFEAATGRPIAVGISDLILARVCFSSDSRTLMTTSYRSDRSYDCTIQLWNLP